MDLLTPASTWAKEKVETASAEGEGEHAHADAPVERMPALQRAVMFCSVVGPLTALVLAIALLWRRGSGGGIGWPEVIVMVVMYALCGFGVTIGFHRLLTHRAFETSRWLKIVLAILGSAAGQGMAIRWCATHRRHHQAADRDGDPHSPHLHGQGILSLLRGMYHAHVGWCFKADSPDLARSVPDLLADPILMRVDQLYFLWVGLGIVLPGAALGLWSHSWHGFFSGAIWGGLVRVGLMQHVTWSINSVCHVWGTRPYRNSDHSTNNLPIALLSLGEGWHNNHHAFPTSARHGLHWWQFDASYVVIRGMEMIGLVKNVRVPANSAMEAKKK